MSTRTIHTESSLFFINFTCFDWLPLFQLTSTYNAAYKWFVYLKEKRDIKTTAYVIMPNHLHCILFFPSPNFSLNKIIGNAKRFMAYEIIESLQATNQTKILDQLASAVTAKERSKGQKHKVFEESFGARVWIIKSSFYRNSITFI